MQIDWVKFGALIRKDRERLGLRQADYAKIAGVAQSQISQLELGKIKYPAYEVVQRIKRQLKVAVVPGEAKPDA